MLQQTLRTVAVGLLMIVAIAVMLVPGQYWPSEWVRYREYRGELAGRPVVLEPPSSRRTLMRLHYQINMTSGICRISRFDRSGQIIPHARMGKGYVSRDKLPSGEQLPLDPGSGHGHYIVGIGLQFHLLSPYIWRILATGLLGGTLIGLVAKILIRKRNLAFRMALKTAFTPWQWAVLIVLAFLSGAFLYSALHESGHALAALALGGRVNSIVFTLLGGDRPHVDFDYLPADAGPWMQAGGVFLPILVAYVLVTVWLALGRRLSLFGQALLLTPALLFLLFSAAIVGVLAASCSQQGAPRAGQLSPVEAGGRCSVSFRLPPARKVFW